MAGGVAQGVGPEFKPQYHTHTKKILPSWSLHSSFKNIYYKNNILFIFVPEAFMF
jgi:hypothetical protein